MFFRKRTESHKTPAEELDLVVESALPGADPDTKSIVTAIVGLAGTVAYADRDFSEDEQKAVRKLLTSVEGVDATRASDIVATLKQHVIAISSTDSARHARTLKRLAAHDLRLHVLDVLLDVATADHELSQEEVVTLRQITKSLGLDQADYNTLQARHKDLIAALK